MEQVLKENSNLTAQEIEAIIAATQGENNNEASTFIVIRGPARDSGDEMDTRINKGQVPEPEDANRTSKAPEHSKTAWENTSTQLVPKRTRTKMSAVRSKPALIKRTAEHRLASKRSAAALPDLSAAPEGPSKKAKHDVSSENTADVSPSGIDWNNLVDEEEEEEETPLKHCERREKR